MQSSFPFVSVSSLCRFVILDAGSLGQELSVTAPESAGTAGIDRAVFLPLCFLGEPNEADGLHEESCVALAGTKSGWMHQKSQSCSVVNPVYASTAPISMITSGY